MATATKTTATTTKSKGAIKPIKTETTAPVSRKAMPAAWLIANVVIAALLAEKSKLVEVKGSMSIPADKVWKGIPENDERKLPRDGHLTLGKAIEAREANRAGALLKEDSDLFDFQDVTTWQVAVAGCKNTEVLEAVTKTLLGKPADLDAAAEAGKADRNKPSDLQYLKELVYCAGTLLHLSAVSQHAQLPYFLALEKFQQRIATLRYNKVKTWDEKGQPAAGARVPRLESAPKQAAPKIGPFREGSVAGKVAAMLLEKKELTRVQIAAVIGSNSGKWIALAEKSGFANATKDKEGAVTVKLVK